MSAVQGQRVPGGFILIIGQDGIRYALRPNQVVVVHDADECQDETILRIYGGEQMARSLVASGDYRVTSRLGPLTEYHPPDDIPKLVAAVVDVETTGTTLIATRSSNSASASSNMTVRTAPGSGSKILAFRSRLK